MIVLQVAVRCKLCNEIAATYPWSAEIFHNCSCGNINLPKNNGKKTTISVIGNKDTTEPLIITNNNTLKSIQKKAVWKTEKEKLVPMHCLSTKHLENIERNAGWSFFSNIAYLLLLERK